MSLFREEALRRRQEVTQAQPLALMPPSWRLITLFLAVLAVGAALFLWFGTFTRKERAAGILRPQAGEAVMAVDRPGTLIALAVAEGQRVSEGSALFDVRTDATLLDGEGLASRSLAAADQQDLLAASEAEARVSEAQARLSAAREKQKGVDALIVALGDQQALVAERMVLVAKQVERTEVLLAKGLSTQRELLQRQDALVSAKLENARLVADLAQARNDRTSLGVEMQRLRAEANASSAQATINKSQRAERRLTLFQNQGYRVRSPIAGQVSGVRFSRGMYIKVGEPVLTVIPVNVPLIAELYVSSRAIGFLSPGQRARLLYDAYPFQKFGAAYGTITSVSRSVAKPADIVATASAEEPQYTVRVALDAQSIQAFGTAHALRPGMTVQADLILENRSVIEWLLEPILSSSGRL